MRGPILIRPTPGIWGIKKNKWPPNDSFKRDRDANRWFNSSFTSSSSLFNALAFFLTTGWPVESLDEFVDAIVPKAGWSEDHLTEADQAWPTDYFRRKRPQYGPSFNALMYGYWEPKE